jgi:hypothetical protein
VVENSKLMVRRRNAGYQGILGVFVSCCRHDIIDFDEVVADADYSAKRYLFISCDNNI